MSYSEGLVALALGGDNPHATGWVETLKHCPSIRHLRLLGNWPSGSDGDYKISDLHEIFERETPDIVLVCSANDEAPSLASISIKAGIPTIVEKPVARNLTEIEKLNDLAKQSGALWTTGFLNRYHPSVSQLKHWIENGAIGRVISIEGRMITSHVEARNPGHWLFSDERAGGGILHWLGIHTIDLIRYLTDSEFLNVCGKVATTVQDIDVEEVATACFSMVGGALGQIHAGYVLPGRYGDISLVIRGTEGDVKWQSWDYKGRRDIVYLQSVNSAWNNVDYHELHCPSPEGPGYGGQMGINYVEDFINSYQNSKSFLVDGNDVANAMKFVEAVYRSAKSGKTEEL